MNKIYRKILLAVLIGLIAISNLTANENYIDSLKQKLEVANDIDKKEIVEQLVTYCSFIDSAIAFNYLKYLEKLKPSPKSLVFYLKSKIYFDNNAFKKGFEALIDGGKVLDFNSLQEEDILLIDLFYKIRSVLVHDKKNADIDSLEYGFNVDRLIIKDSLSYFLVKSRMCFWQEDYEQMYEQLNRAIQASKASAESRMNKRIILDLSTCLIALSKYNESIEVLDTFMLMGTKSNDAYLTRFYYNYSIAYDSLGKYRMALECIDKAIAINGSVLLKFQLLTQKIKLFNKLGKHRESKVLISKILDGLKETPFYELQKDVLQCQNEIFNVERDYSNVYITLKEIYAIDSVIFYTNKEMHEAFLDIKYKTKDKEHQLLLVQKKNKLNEIELLKHRFYILILIVLIIFLFAIAFFFYKRYTIRKKVNSSLIDQVQLIQRQHNEIVEQSEGVKKHSNLLEIQIDELKAVNKELNKMMSIVDQGNNAIMIINLNGDIKWVNKGFEKMFGYSLEEYVKAKGGNIYKASANEEIKNDIAYCMSNKQSVIYYAQNTTKSGDEKWIQTTLSPILNNDGELDKLVAVDTDYTQLKKAEENLSYRKSKEKSQNMKKAVLNNISNEMLLPLEIIINYTAALKQSFEDKKPQKYLNTIYSNSMALKNTISEILCYLELQLGKIGVENEKVKIKHFIKKLSLDFEKKVQEKDLSFFIDIDSKVAESYLLDKKMVGQVLQNLIGNAIKFTEEGFVKLSIKTLENKDTTYLRFLIEDTGIGISAIEEQKVFDIFSQICEHTIRKYGGIGLGLTMVKQILSLLDGTITIKCKNDKGVIVKVDIPVETVEVSVSGIEDIVRYDLESDIMDVNINAKLLINDIENLDNKLFVKFINEDLEELISLYNNADKTKSINEIKRLTFKLQFVSQKYKLNSFFEFKEELELLMFSFEISLIENSFDEFQKLIEFIENKLNE